MTLGPVSGATVTVRNLKGDVVGEGESDIFDETRDRAQTGSRFRLKNIAEGRRVGKVTFTRLDLDSLDDADLVELRASRGHDVDGDDSGLITASEGNAAPEIGGGPSAVVRVSDLKAGTVFLNPLSSLASGALAGTTDSFDIIDRINRLTIFTLKGLSTGGDVNGDKTVDYRDLYAFDPTLHDFTTSTPTRPNDAKLATELWAKRIVAASGDATTVAARLSAGGSGNLPASLDVDLFGDLDGDGLANVFGDPATQDTDADGTKDQTDTDIDGDGIPNTNEVALGFSPWNRDMNQDGTVDGDEDPDGDGLTTRAELSPIAPTKATDPLKADTDGDGFNDKVENDNGLDPTVASGPDVDTDGDTIKNGDEIAHGLNPSDPNDGSADLDEDGLSNAIEINTYKTDIRNKDTDSDGFLDNEEVANGFDPLSPADGGQADADSDGISNILEVRNGLDPRDADDALLDPDEDGLTNKDEAVLYHTNVDDADSDDDALDDKREVLVTLTDPNDADSDDDGRLDGAEIDDPLYPSDPHKADTDGDGLTDKLEAETSTGEGVERIRLYDGTPINTSPTSIDTDGDGISDALEIAVQTAFAAYGPVQQASNMLRGALHPNNPATPAQLGGLTFLTGGLTPAALEEDPDGDGKPTIEEIFHATDPNDRTSTFAYIYEAPSGGGFNERRQAMDANHFVYVPGGWDADGDGISDPGFYVSRFEARAASGHLSATTDERAGINGQIVYATISRTFSGRLCNTVLPTDSDASDSQGACRGNQYNVTDTETLPTEPFPERIHRLDFDPALLPYVSLTWLEARLAALNTKVDARGALGGPYRMDLPSEAQWMQMVELAVTNPSNWTGGAVAAGGLYRGHTDNSPTQVLPVTDTGNGYTDTGNGLGNGPDQRRTLLLKNGTRARDFDVPLSYVAEVWDLSGNASEWTAALFAAKGSTARPVDRQGGDRFVNGLSELWDYRTGTNLSGYAVEGGLTNMPTWWKPRLLDGTVLGTTNGAGAYNDGAAASDTDGVGGSDGAAQDVNYGYGEFPFSDGFAAVLRGGDFATGFTGGIAHADVQNGIGRQLPRAGFRTVIPAR